MRIVGGKCGGRRFSGPTSDKTRPTSDRVREALASILDSRDAITNACVLDLYAGTGGLAFEMLSRGAKEAVCVESESRMCKIIADNSRELGLPVRVVRATLAPKPGGDSLFEQIRREQSQPATLVFADPPYDIASQSIELLLVLKKKGVVAHDAMLVVEHATREPLVIEEEHALSIVAQYRYGDTSVTLLAFDEGSS